MRQRRFQNSVCQSAATLPVSIAVGALLWFLTPASDACSSISLDVTPYGVAAIVAYVMAIYIIMETNNQNALIRVRTRIVSAIWALLIGILPSAHHLSGGLCAALGLAASHHLLFRSYQKFQPVTDVFHAFAFYGIACIAMPQLVVLIPLYYWYLIVFMRCITWRVFWAGVVGMLTPMWLMFGYCILTGSWEYVFDRVEVLADSFRPDIADWACLLSWSSPGVLVFAFLTLTGFLGIVHFMQSRYDDKIRTRMLLYIYVWQSVGVWLVTVFNPSVYEEFIPSLVVCLSPILAHHFALTNRVVTNVYFCLCLMTAVIIAFLNYGISY